MVGRRTGYLQYSHVRVALASDNNPAARVLAHRRRRRAQQPGDVRLHLAEISAQATTSLDMIDFKANRTLWDLPGGPLALAVGAEYRRTQVELTPLTHTDAGDIIGLGYSAYKGTEKVGVLARRAAGADRRQLRGPPRCAPTATRAATPRSLRRSASSGRRCSGWRCAAPTGEGFRAPNAAEAGEGGLAAFTTANDPVRCPGGTPLPGASQADWCAAAPLAIITSPNPDLEPEESGVRPWAWCSIPPVPPRSPSMPGRSSAPTRSTR